MFDEYINNKKPSILFITHNKAGGTERCVMEMAFTWEKKGWSVFIVRPYGNILKMYNLNWDNKISLNFVIPNEYEAFINICKIFGVKLIHYHHLIGYPEYICELSKKLRCKYYITLHDYFCICPRINLMREEKYCEEKECNKCISLYFNKKDIIDIDDWRNKWNIFLRNAEKITVPSKDTLFRIKRYFSDLNIYIVENPEIHKSYINSNLSNKPPKVLKIGILGNISKSKGADLLYECSRYAEKMNLPIKYIVIGTTYKKTKGFFNNKLKITGAYVDKNLLDIIKKEDIDIFFFPTKIPETFSYTLSATILAKRPSVVFNIGAIAERVKKYQIGWCIPLEFDAVDINKFFAKYNYYWKIYKEKEKAFQYIKLKDKYEMKDYYSKDFIYLKNNFNVNLKLAIKYIEEYKKVYKENFIKKIIRWILKRKDLYLFEKISDYLTEKQKDIIKKLLNI